MHALIKILLKKSTPQYKSLFLLKNEQKKVFILRDLFKTQKAIQVKYLDSLMWFIQWKNFPFYYGKIPKFI
jgi:hypothetical protein